MSVDNSFLARGFSLSGHTVNEFDFIRVWQTSTSIREARQKLDLPSEVDNQRLSQLAGRLRRDNGIPLKKYVSGGTSYTDEDYDLLSEFAKWVVEESKNGIPDEALTYERFQRYRDNGQE